MRGDAEAAVRRLCGTFQLGIALHLQSRQLQGQHYGRLNDREHFIKFNAVLYQQSGRDACASI